MIEMRVKIGAGTTSCADRCPEVEPEREESNRMLSFGTGEEYSPPEEPRTRRDPIEAKNAKRNGTAIERRPNGMTGIEFGVLLDRTVGGGKEGSEGEFALSESNLLQP